LNGRPNNFMKRGRNQRRRQGGMNINRALDSNGPEVRIRGTANQIYDKYLALARDASSSGDRVKAENYLQHAEHYFRVIRAIQPAQAPQPDQAGEGGDFEGDQPSIGDGQGRFDNGRDGDQSGHFRQNEDAQPPALEEQPEAPRGGDPQRANGELEQRSERFEGEGERGRRRRHRSRRPYREGEREPQDREGGETRSDDDSAAQ